MSRWPFWFVRSNGQRSVLASSYYSKLPLNTIFTRQYEPAEIHQVVSTSRVNKSRDMNNEIAGSSNMRANHCQCISWRDSAQSTDIVMVPNAGRSHHNSTCTSPYKGRAALVL